MLKPTLEEYSSFATTVVLGLQSQVVGLVFDGYLVFWCEPGSGQNIVNLVAFSFSGYV